MHGADDPTVRRTLERVEIATIADRTGQLLRHELMRRFKPRGGPAPDLYTLKLSLSEKTEGIGLRIDETATRINLTMTARFAMHDKATGLTRLRGIETSINGYNVLRSDFATVHARADARRRAITRIADGITRRVSAWILQNHGPENGPGERG